MPLSRYELADALEQLEQRWREGRFDGWYQDLSGITFYTWPDILKMASKELKDAATT